MSHTTTLKSVAIRDIAALIATVNELRAQGVDIELLNYKDTKVLPRMYSSGQATDLISKGLEYTIKLKKATYDVGLLRQDDGTFVPAFDSFMGSIEREIGTPKNATCPVAQNYDEQREQAGQRTIGKFMQIYAKNAAINAALAQGYQVESAYVDDTGSVQLTINADQGGF